MQRNTSNPSVVVVTPTCGSPKVLDAFHSVQTQTYSSKHLLVVDGTKFVGNFVDTLNSDPTIYKRDNYDVLYLPQNTGNLNGEKYWGHRIFAGIANFVNEDIIVFLDDDNWFEPTHLEEHVKNIVENKRNLSFSLRNICADDGTFLFQDNCESIGSHAVFNSQPGSNHFHVDTSAYAFRREYLLAVGHLWHGGYAQDRKFWAAVSDDDYTRWGGTGKYTLNYRLGSTKDSAARAFFEIGNKVMEARHGGKYPWAK